MRTYKILLEVRDYDLELAIDDIDLVILQLKEACYNTETVSFLEYGRND